MFSKDRGSDLPMKMQKTSRTDIRGAKTFFGWLTTAASSE
jgi:hypothetical protein